MAERGGHSHPGARVHVQARHLCRHLWTEVCNHRSRLAQGTCVPAALASTQRACPCAALLAPVLGSASATNAAGVADTQCAARQHALAFITNETKKQAPALALVNRVCVCVCVRERERDRENERERA